MGGVGREQGSGVQRASLFSLLPVKEPALVRAVAAGSQAASVPPPTDDGYTPTAQPRRQRERERQGKKKRVYIRVKV